MAWPRQRDARGENTKINYGFYTTGEKERERPRKTWMEGVQAAMTTRNLKPDQWRNRVEWRLISGRRRQLLKNQMDGWMDQQMYLERIILSYGNIHLVYAAKKQTKHSTFYVLLPGNTI